MRRCPSWQPPVTPLLAMQSGILLWHPVSEDALPYTPLRMRSVSRRPRGTVVLLRLLLPPGHFDVRQCGERHYCSKNCRAKMGMHCVREVYPF